MSAVQARAGETRAGQQLVPVSADGDVCLYSSTAVDLIVDLSGTTSTVPTGKTFTSTQPYRLLDTRITGGYQVNPITNGLALIPNTTYSLPAAGVYGMPAAAKAVAVNVTAVGGSTGFVQVFDCSTQQTASALNMNSTAAVANNVHVPLSSTGRLCIRSNVAVHIIVDVYGWWS